jgi:putative addiction module component (TIGR02574 family)
MTHLMNKILKLSPSDRISMVEAIWDSLAGNDNLPDVSPETKHLLDARLEAHDHKPEKGSEWSEVKARIEEQL